jgi:hypothetical protein
MPKTTHQFAKETVFRFHKIAGFKKTEQLSPLNAMAALQLQVDIVNLLREYLEKWSERDPDEPARPREDSGQRAERSEPQPGSNAGELVEAARNLARSLG